MIPGFSPERGKQSYSTLVLRYTPSKRAGLRQWYPSGKRHTKGIPEEARWSAKELFLAV